MIYKRYPSLEKLGNSEVVGIEIGTVDVYPKIDGTNALVYLGDDGDLHAGSRNRELGLWDKDNAGFYAHVLSNPVFDELKKYLIDRPTYVVYGEWLVPNQIKHYKESAKRQFYVFDVYDSGTDTWLAYEVYAPVLSNMGMNVIPLLAKVTDGTLDDFLKIARECRYLLNDNPEAYSEGVVIKRVGFVNEWGRTTWAKIITDEYKDNKGVKQEAESFEELFIARACTSALIGKVYAKIMIENNNQWSPVFIGRLLGEVYHDMIKEELWDFLKAFKKAVIDFPKLQKLANEATKQNATDAGIKLYELHDSN